MFPVACKPLFGWGGRCAGRLSAVFAVWAPPLDSGTAAACVPVVGVGTACIRGDRRGVRPLLGVGAASTCVLLLDVGPRFACVPVWCLGTALV